MKTRAQVRRDLEIAQSRYDEAERVTEAFKLQLSRRRQLGRGVEAVNEALAQVDAAEAAEVLAWQEWDILRSQLAELNMNAGVAR